MKLGIYVVYDSCAEVFGRPLFLNSKAEAIRSFCEESVRDGSPVAESPGDYTIYYIGEYDDASAVIEGSAPSRLINGLEAVASQRKKFEQLAALHGEIERLQSDLELEDVSKIGGTA